MDNAKKSLGQHWLRNNDALQAVVKMGQVGAGDTVLEIGPGHGTLTAKLLETGASVVAVEFDEDLASSLANKLGEPQNLEVINQDFLMFDLTELTKDYKVVGNIPYFLSGKIIRKILDSTSLPIMTSLLVQQEVAERLAAEPGHTSILTILTQHKFTVELGPIIKAELFEPAPKVDSRVVGLKRRGQIREVDDKKFTRIVKAGFSARRKKLINNLAAGLRQEKEDIANVAQDIGLNPNIRAQELTLQNWYQLHDSLSVE